MLLPSSIHRADDLVGIAIPIVGLPCASAALAKATADNPASPRVAIVVFSFSMVRSLSFLFRVRFCVEIWDFVGLVTCLRASKFDVRFGTAARSGIQEKSAAGLGIAGSCRRA